METLWLRPLTLEDVDTIYAWSQDDEFCLSNGWSLGLSHQKIKVWWIALLKTPTSVMVRQGIMHGGQLVGFVELSHINPILQTASFGIAIGARDLWGQGLGTQAGRLMIQQGFQEMGLRQIHAEVHMPNVRSLALMKKLGFRKTGVLKEHEVYRGQPSDVVLFALDRPDSTCCVDQ